MKVTFKTLPADIQNKIVSTLYFYNDCHIEHAHGKMEVATSYALKAKYAEDEWISQEFTREELGITYDGNYAWYDAWNALERKHNKKWAEIDNEAKEKCSEDFNTMIEERAKKDVERIIKEAR